MHSRLSFRRRRVLPGFTLVEVLIVVTIIAILAALTMGAFSYATQTASRSRTTTALGQIKSALEQYKEKFGEYPDWPQDSSGNGGTTTTLGGTGYLLDGAAMLYQAITGDGTSFIKMSTSAPGAGTASDGVISPTEAQNAINPDLPKSLFLAVTTSGGTPVWVMVDGFGHPFQYFKATIGTGAAATATTIGPNYDLWSYAQSATSGASANGAMAYDLKTRQGNATVWIKNWQ